MFVVVIDSAAAKDVVVLKSITDIFAVFVCSEDSMETTIFEYTGPIELDVVETGSVVPMMFDEFVET